VIDKMLMILTVNGEYNNKLSINDDDDNFKYLDWTDSVHIIHQ